MKKGVSRRDFLHDSLLAAAAAAAAGSTSKLLSAEAPQRAKGPNEKLRVAVIGVHGRGNAHLEGFTNERNGPEVDLVAVCDADTIAGQRGCTFVERRTGRRPKFIKDMRAIFDDPSIDCVSMATPNHWHALGAIWAMQAGKHVYVEKPCSHNVSEGRRMVEAARKYNRICQVGTQSRSSGGARKAIDYVKAGKLGDVKFARGLCYKRRPSIGPKGDYPIPAEIDYNLWCGPAPMEAVSHRNSPKDGPVHYDWHWIWDFGNGDLGNQGVHQIDIARWGLELDGLPAGVIAYGGRFGDEDAGETPNTEVAVLDYGPKTIVFEVRGLPTRSHRKTRSGVGVVFEGTSGYVALTSYSNSAAFDLNGKLVERFQGGGDHFADFLKAVRSGNKDDLSADILEGHLSAALCHLGNISYRLGEPMQTGAIAEKLVAVEMQDDAQATLDSTVRHLRDNEVKIDEGALFQCGDYLKFDADSETFPGNDKANAMCTREYRAPFVVPGAGHV